MTGFKEASEQQEIFDRIDFTSNACPQFGQVRWSAVKSLWWSGMTLTWLVMGIWYFSFPALMVFFVLCSLTLCLGHSIGMHRKLIHNAFECPKWIERILVYLGTLVGLGGPFTMMQMHDMRDWAQRQPNCHAFLAHQRGIVQDYYWQLHCKLYLDNSPQYKYPKWLKEDKFYRFLQATSMLQQIPLGLALYYLGGWGFVAWGICGRVSVSIFGHWLVGYFAHNKGERSWHLEGVAVQGYNISHLGLITFGECWHNNHHAYPSSAKLGLEDNQIDPGWQVLKVMKSVGLVSNLNTPEELPKRKNLKAITEVEV